MCNLSQGIKEQAYAEGTENGIAKGVAKIIIKMYRKGYEAEQISDIFISIKFKSSQSYNFEGF